MHAAGVPVVRTEVSGWKSCREFHKPADVTHSRGRICPSGSRYRGFQQGKVFGLALASGLLATTLVGAGSPRGLDESIEREASRSKARWSQASDPPVTHTRRTGIRCFRCELPEVQKLRLYRTGLEYASFHTQVLLPNLPGASSSQARR